MNRSGKSAFLGNTWFLYIHLIFIKYMKSDSFHYFSHFISLKISVHYVRLPDVSISDFTNDVSCPLESLQRDTNYEKIVINQENRHFLGIHGSYIFTWFLLNTWRAILFIIFLTSFPWKFQFIMSGYQMWVSLTSLMMCPALWRAYREIQITNS